jgi:hypothetical protein
MCLSSASGRCCIEGLDFLYRCEFVLPKFIFLDAYSGLRGHLDSFVMMQLHSIAIKLGVFIAPLGCHKGTFFLCRFIPISDHPVQNPYASAVQYSMFHSVCVV